MVSVKEVMNRVTTNNTTHTKGVHSGEHVQNFSTSSVLYYAVGQCFH